ncbi:MAG: septum formation initiator family protein [Gammaproteobacteria bacterium]|nr:septum formation initiator family protein [Gammaproteobacteria bacterium]
MRFKAVHDAGLRPYIRKMRALTLALGITLGSLQFALWAGDKNFIDLYRLGNAVEQHSIDNVALSMRNQKLLAEVIDLKQGGETIETLARSELGLIKAEETFYQIID